jgi:Ni/Co efflux regulator RcnB
MKKMLLSAAALAALLSAPAAMAQDQNDKPRQEDRATPGNDKPDQGKPDQGAKPDRGGDRMNGGAMQGGDQMKGPGNGPDRDKTRDVDVHKNVDVNKNVTVHRAVDKTVVMKARANITAPRKFHIAAYVKPPGWYEHRWTYGEILPRAFFAPNFVIVDFAAYDLLAPWDGYEWVRYGDDALLINVDTGEVIRVEYGLFD